MDYYQIFNDGIYITFPRYYNSNTVILSNLYGDICNDSNHPHVIMSVHHKTGTHILREFLSTFKEYYYRKCNKIIENGEGKWLDINANAFGKWLEIQVYDRWINKTLILIHCIRNPVDTIISAYNYHKLISVEAQTSKHLYNNYQSLLNAKNDRKNPIGGYREYCYNYMLFQNDSILKIPDTLYKNYTIKQLLNDKFNLSMGLLYEYEKYLCYDWKDINTTHQFMLYLNKIEGYNNISNRFIIPIELSLEEFILDFNGSCHRLLNAMGIYNVSERKWLMNSLVQYDLNRLNNSKEESHSSLIRNHVTQGKYDKNKQLSLLLGDDQSRCINLKNMTHLLNMTWAYTDYC